MAYTPPTNEREELLKKIEYSFKLLSNYWDSATFENLSDNELENLKTYIIGAYFLTKKSETR